MAIVLNTTPGTRYSAHGDIIFIAYEATKATDPVTYPNYKYVCDIYINGNLESRLKAVPDPSYNRGVFNISAEVRNYLAATFNPTTGLLIAQEMAAGAFYISVTCKFGEEIDGVLTADLTVDSARKYYNHYNGRLSNGTGSILQSVADAILSNRPLVSSVSDDNQNVFLPFIVTTANDPDVTVRVYSGGTLTSTNYTNVTPPAAETLVIFNFGIASLNTLHGNIITSASTHYTVDLNGTLYRFNIHCDPKFENYTLHFLNKFGGWESYDFAKVSRKTLNLERRSYNKLPYTFNSSGQLSYQTNNVYNDTNPTFATVFTEKLKLNTDLLSDDEYSWLGELIVSPSVYLQDGSYFVPVTITGSDYEYKKQVNEGELFNLTIDLEFGVNYNAQYR